MARPKKYSDWRLLKRLFAQTGHFWPHFIALFVLSLLDAPLSLLVPVPLKMAVDNVVGSQPLPDFLSRMLPASVVSSDSSLTLFLAGLLVFFTFILYVRSMLDWLLMTYTGEKMVLVFRARMLDHIQRLSFTYHDTKGSSDSIYRVQYDTDCLQQITMGAIKPLIMSAFTVFSIFFILMKLDWKIALVAIGVSPILMFLTASLRGKIRDSWSSVKEYRSAAMSIVHELLTSLRVIKAYGQEERERGRFIEQSTRGLKQQVYASYLAARFDLIIALTIAAGSATVLTLGVTHVLQKTLSLGELLLIMAYLTELYGPLQKITKTITNLQSSLASAERVFTVLDETPSVMEKPDSCALAAAKGQIEFRNISFTYADGNEALKGVSFQIEPGQRIGISGTTGAGKTTLISLLMRFYDPTEGTIFLDGKDLRDYKIRDLRNQFALVLQEPVLFSTSIAANIAYADATASEAEIIAAAKAAHAHEFIINLPNGYETEVGERGMLLSGGERQRITLARAFLKNAPIMIFDEPTSSVDIHTESLIMDALTRLMKDRTAIMIAHRISTLESCDVKLRIENGRVVSFQAGQAEASMRGPEIPEVVD